MAYSIDYLSEAIDCVIASLNNNESLEMQEKKICILFTVADGFKKEFEFQKYLVELINTKLHSRKILIANLIKLHIMKLYSEINKKENINDILYNFKKSPMIPRNTRTNKNIIINRQPIEDIILEEIPFDTEDFKF
jgi:hypothetical protein